MTQPDLATHELKFSAWYTADEPHDGLAPYWALSDLLINHADGYVETSVEVEGERWDVRLNYSNSGIAPRESDDVARETLYEFDLTAQGYSQRKVHVNFSPRFPGMAQPSGEPITTPWMHFDDVDAGVDAQVQGSNVDIDEYGPLVNRFLHELAVEADYALVHTHFDEPFGARVQELERYLRLNYDQSTKLVGDTGVLQRLMMLLAETRGSKAEYKIDNEGRVGKFRALQLHAADVAEIFPRHTAAWGRQVKSYLMREDDAFDEDDALYHPKVGALYRKSLSERTVDWDDRHQLVRELDETVLNLLSWSTIPTDVGDGSGEGGGTTVFVPDDHFDVVPRDQTLPISPDPTPELEAKQESLLVWALGQITSTESDSDIATALADGGKHRHDLAAETGWSMSTLYRALQRFDGAIESENGHFRFASRQLARDVQALIQRVEDTKSSVMHSAERLLNAEIRSNSTSAFERWLAKYAAEFVEPRDDTGGRPVIRIGTVLSRLKSTSQPRVQAVVDEMVRAWRDDYRDPDDIMDAVVEVDLVEDDDYKTLVSAAV